MGRPILDLAPPINKRRPSSSLRELSRTLHSAATNLRTASSTTRHQRLSAINSAYRGAYRAALALQAEHGASPSSPPPPPPSSLPSLGTRLSRPRDHDLERLLRRTERLPRLPLPAALAHPMADLAARSAQLERQRRLLDQAVAGMRDLHERLLTDMERTAQHFVDIQNATGVHGPGPDPPSNRIYHQRRSLPPGVVRARLRAAVADLPDAFRAAARAAREDDNRAPFSPLPSTRPVLPSRTSATPNLPEMPPVVPRVSDLTRPTPTAVRIRRVAVESRGQSNSADTPTSHTAENATRARESPRSGPRTDA